MARVYQISATELIFDGAIAGIFTKSETIYLERLKGPTTVIFHGTQEECDRFHELLRHFICSDDNLIDLECIGVSVKEDSPEISEEENN